MGRKFPYNPGLRVQYGVRYMKQGLWHTEYFTTSQRALAFRSLLLASPTIDTVSRVFTLFG